MKGMEGAWKYLLIFIALYIFVQFVSATGGTLLTALSGLNGTFASTGLGSLFAPTLVGIVLVAGIFIVVWKMIKSF